MSEIEIDESMVRKALEAARERSLAVEDDPDTPELRAFRGTLQAAGMTPEVISKLEEDFRFRLLSEAMFAFSLAARKAATFIKPQP